MKYWVMIGKFDRCAFHNRQYMGYEGSSALHIVAQIVVAAADSVGASSGAASPPQAKAKEASTSNTERWGNDMAPDLPEFGRQHPPAQQKRGSIERRSRTFGAV